MASEFINSYIKARLPYVIERDSLAITVSDISCEDDLLVVSGEAFNDSQRIPISWPVIIVNQPRFFVQENGILVDDPVRCFNQTLIDLALSTEID